MRGIILALLLTLAGSEKSQNGITLSGMPDKGLSKAGLKVNHEAEISGFAQRTFMPKVQQFDIKEYNRQWPRDPFTRSTKRTQAIAEQIKQPFKFEYHDGRVGDVFAAEGVSSTVVNMIQGILNMLQAQIRKSQNVYDLEEVSDTLQHLAQNNQQEVQAEAPAKFLQLIQLLRDLSPENIQAILKQYSDKPLYWQWLAKTIPLIGTAESLKVVKRNIPNQSTQEAAMSITLALQHTRGSQNALQIAAPLHDFAAEAANKAHTEEMTIPLKAIDNAGQVSSIKRLPGFSSSAHQLPVRVQVEAEMALRNIARNDPKRVEEDLHSSLKKRSTDTEVRMPDAVLMENRPSAAAMISMADAIQKDTKVDLQLSDFVYSYMKDLNQTTAP